MEASIRESNVKHFVRLLQCAARYGDDLCIDTKDFKWELAVTNSSKSAYCRFTLEPSFFSRYRPLGSKAQQERGIKCQLHVRSVLGVLGKASSVNAVDRVDLKIVDPEGGLQAASQMDEDPSDDDDIRVASRSAFLELRLVYRHGVTKKHHLHVQSSECLKAEVDPDTTPSGFLISAKVLRDWLDHFTIAFGSSAGGNSRADSHLAWLFSEHEVRVKNFETATTNVLSTEIKIDVNEFQCYEIDMEDIALALPMREFKATLQLAEQFNMDLDFAFSEASQPMTLTSRYFGLDRHGKETLLFDIFCAIATTPTEAFPDARTSNDIAHQLGKKRTATSSVKPENGSDTRRSVSARAATARSGSARQGSARPRASLNFTGQVARPSNSGAGLQGRAGAGFSQSGDGLAHEPLFQPGPTQSSQGVRMTQQEALELAGMGDLDMDALLDEDDEDDDLVAAPTMSEDRIPAGMEEVEADFGDVSAQPMSTQRDAIVAAQSREVSLQAPSDFNAQKDLSMRDGATDPAHEQREISLSNIKRSESAADFKPDMQIFNPTTADARERGEEVRGQHGESNGADQEDVDEDVEELDEDAMDSTQPSGHKFQQFFAD